MNPKVIGAIAAIILALAWIQRSMHPGPPAEQTMPAQGIGQVLAEQVALAADDQGPVAFAFTSAGPIEEQAELEAFKKTLAQHKNITLMDCKVIKLSETSVGSLPFDQFATFIKEHSKAKAIVFALGITSFTEDQIATLPKPTPKLIVVDWNPQYLDRAIKLGLVKAAIRSRHLTALPETTPKTPRQWFDYYCEVVTPQ
ncbi:MAG: hypothetical protein WCS94_06780 [Verrucomicrobiota bacterium]